MSCPYYWYDNHYACRKSGKDVNEDIYYKYCRNYDYDDCPIYKSGSSSDSSGCFLTSACVTAMGLPDDCYELVTLRKFRDNYMRHTTKGKSDICEYYHVAPAIVQAISKEQNSIDIFKKIYDELVCPCVALIEKNKNEDAYEKYRLYVKKLQSIYL